MATDFFQRQETARRQTFVLLGLFAAAVIVLVGTLYLVCALLLSEAAQGDEYFAAPAHSLWHPELFLTVATGTLLVIGLGSLYKIVELAAGGQKVALMLGGRQIQPQTRDLAERRLLNVVEEMSLASGVGVPPVYVLDGEPGINAFAAGHRPEDAVVAVSRGALRYLNRDELQGVVAHEFSHILNGDMRLNLRLIGVVHGILVLSIIGYYVFRIATESSGRSRSSKKEGNAMLAVVLLGLALMILGYVGKLCGQVIKAAISRQREYLADASAVQFTRNPSGISGALKKIGGLAEGSQIRDTHAAEISHMFFGDAFAGTLFNLFATHPPLADRIRALESDFDGRFPAIQPVDDEGKEPAAAGAGRSRAKADSGGETVVAALAEPSSTRAAPREARRLIPRTGTLGPEQVNLAGRLLASLPPALKAAASEPYSARALIFALLLARDPPTRARQLEYLQKQVESLCFRETQQFSEVLATTKDEVRLPLVELAMPALRSLALEQYRVFRQTVEGLVAVDGMVDLFEYGLRTVLYTSLDVAFGLARAPAVRYSSFDAVSEAVSVVLSTLAYAGHAQAEEARQAFAAAGLPATMRLRPAEQCTLVEFDRALRTLGQASPAIQKRVLQAGTACVATDGKVTMREEELLRVLGAALGCPIGLAAE